MLRKLALTLLVGTALSPVLFAGCGGSSALPDGGRDAKDANDAKAGTGGGAGTGGVGGGTAGTVGVAGSDGGVDVAAAGTGGLAGADGGAPDLAIDTTPAPPDGSMGKSWLFPTTTDGWVFSKYGSTPENSPNAADNLATLAGAPAWDPANDANNQTTSGSLKGTIPFKKAGDRIDFQAFSQAAGKYDWIGYKITAKVKLVSGGNIASGCPLSAWLYVSQATDYQTRLSPTVNLQTGNWVSLSFDLSTATINIGAVNQMGIQISTGAACGTSDGGADGGAADGGDAGTDLLVDAGLVDASDAAPATATTAVILIDDVIVSVK